MKNTEEVKRLTQTYKIRSYECNKFGVLRILSLMNILQDAADAHADRMGLGWSFCKANGYAWVGANYEIEINCLPKWKEDICVTTWPAVEKKISAIRDFVITDINGNKIIKASSEWVLIDVIKRRPLSIRTIIPQHFSLDERALDTDFNKIVEPQEFDYIKHIKAEFDDIDINGHVNNCVYSVWALESLPLEILETKSISKINISFKKECLLGQDVEVCVKIEDNQSTHIVKSNGIELAKIKFIY